MGGHVVGFAGQRVIQCAGTKVKWITGLDPAGPLFEDSNKQENERLSSDDGDVVEVIHTDGGVLGFNAPIGTIDFYPNGGKHIQPNCANIEEMFKEFTELVTCSHHKCIEYYTYAVRRGGVAATQCGSWEDFKKGECKRNQRAKFGTKKPSKRRGSYYVAIDR